VQVFDLFYLYLLSHTTPSFVFFLLFVLSCHIGASIVPVFPIIRSNRSHWRVYRSRFSYYSFKPVTLARLSFPVFLLFVQTGHIGASIVPVFPVIRPNRSHWSVHPHRSSCYSFVPVTLDLLCFLFF